MSECISMAEFAESVAPERERLSELGRLLDIASQERRECDSEAMELIVVAEIEELKAERAALIQELMEACAAMGLGGAPIEAEASPGCAQHSPAIAKAATLLKDCRRLLPGSTLGDRLRSRIGAWLREWGES